jgi:hypothetical protein
MVHVYCTASVACGKAAAMPSAVPRSEYATNFSNPAATLSGPSCSCRAATAWSSTNASSPSARSDKGGDCLARREYKSAASCFALGFLSFRWKRVELGWVAYAAVAFGTLKLLFEDLRFGNAASLVVSLLFYGLILILLPRLTRRGQAKL